MSDAEGISSLMDALREDTLAFNGVIVPANDRDFDGAGIEDQQAGMSRMATPLDLQSFAGITPPSSWQQLGTILVDDLLPRITAEDVLKLATSLVMPGQSVFDPVYARAAKTIGKNPGVFGTSAGMAYSDYIKDSAVGIVDLVKQVVTFAIDQQMFAASLATLSLSLPAKALTATIFDGQAPLAQAVFAADGETLLAEIAVEIAALPGSGPNIAMAAAIVDALRALRAAFLELIDMSPPELFDLVGELPLLIAEMLRDRVLQTRIESVVGDAAKLGDVVGTLIGIVVWEIIEEVATAGMSKPLKFLKVAT